MRQDLMFTKACVAEPLSAGINDHYSDLSEDEKSCPLARRSSYPLSHSCWKVRTSWRNCLSLNCPQVERINWVKTSFVKPLFLHSSVSDMLELAIMLKVAWWMPKKPRVQDSLHLFWKHRGLRSHSEEPHERRYFLCFPLAKMELLQKTLSGNHAWLLWCKDGGYLSSRWTLPIK